MRKLLLHCIASTLVRPLLPPSEEVEALLLSSHVKLSRLETWQRTPARRARYALRTGQISPQTHILTCTHLHVLLTCSAYGPCHILHDYQASPSRSPGRGSSLPPLPSCPQVCQEQPRLNTQGCPDLEEEVKALSAKLEGMHRRTVAELAEARRNGWDLEEFIRQVGHASPPHILSHPT